MNSSILSGQWPESKHGLPITHNKHLTRLEGLRNMASLTKNKNTQCQALNMAFFVPEILAFGTSDPIPKMDKALFPPMEGINLIHAKAIGLFDKLIKRIRYAISKYGRVNGRIQDRLGGNKSSRVLAISDTRPPEFKTGELTKIKNGGHPMSNKPLYGLHSVGSFSIQINLPNSAFISGLFAHSDGPHWLLVVETSKGQSAIIKDVHGQNMAFATLDALAQFLADHGAISVSVSLINLNSNQEAA